MVKVLIVSNNKKEDVEKIKSIIEDISNEFFIHIDISIIKEGSSFSGKYDFAVVFNDNLDLNIKTIDATPIILDRFGEKVEKDIQNQLLKAKATYVRENKNKGV